MIGRTNCKRGGSGNVTEVTLTGQGAGETVTATCTGKPTKTATTNASGVATFKNLDMGYNWTFAWSTFSKTEKIDQLSESVTLGAITVHWYTKHDAGSGNVSLSVTIYEGAGIDPNTADNSLRIANFNGTCNGYNWTDNASFDIALGQQYTLWIRVGSMTAPTVNLSEGLNTGNYLFAPYTTGSLWTEKKVTVTPQTGADWYFDLRLD